jgi:hypothetical protein
MQLLSQSKNTQTEKQALMKFIAGAGDDISKGIYNLSKRDDFVGGLAGPVVNAFGGLKKLVGRGRQMPALYKDPKATRDVLMKDKLFAQGAKDIRRGEALRTRAGIDNIFNADKSVGYRVGRGVGAVGIGAPIVLAPLTLSSYLGAANADPQLAQEYAKNMAYDRVEDRLNQFSKMPFLDRIQSAWNPEKFSENLQSPEAIDINENLASNNINNPGILKYLSSFNPFLSSPDDVIRQRIRSEVLRNMQGNKSASDSTKQANILSQLFNKVLKPAYNLGKQYRGLPDGTKLPKAIRNYTGTPGKTYLENMAERYAMNLGKNPVMTSLGTLGAAYTASLPFGMYDSYQAGKNQVYNDAANTAMGLADLGIMEKFNQPGFMGGLNRFGMAIAPGIGKDMILNQIRQSMFPEVNRQQ